MRPLLGPVLRAGAPGTVDVVFYRLHPHWMTVFAPDVAKLTAE
ncbi:hypothetical protein GCM10018793_22190 [Streptomyces sulfonofaciens]|uniref:Uncharacterized protein n=1 Tax=Streptomyces sulfonofaciens TaxID=68272 RepID=A0A919G2K2_9ACTN|nr:hypothetical protein [Streptomyces sulfonofaciens]GHH76459.1 hypothetical protein GCM10018793_22190 [Streptomyces sulfonofaciens]